MVYSVSLKESVESEDYESNVKAVDATYVDHTQRQALLQVSTVKKNTQSSGLLAPEGALHWWRNFQDFFLILDYLAIQKKISLPSFSANLT